MCVNRVTVIYYRICFLSATPGNEERALVDEMFTL